MNNNMFLTGAGVLALLVFGGLFLAGNRSAPSSSSAKDAPQAVTHSLTLMNRKLAPDIVTVMQGDQVTIQVLSDEAGEFHLSGYEIMHDLEAGKELSFAFTADKAGRYNFELHPGNHESQAFRWINVAEASEVEGEEDIVVGAFVVNPR